MTTEFKDQVAIITGAASGLGAAIAVKLSAQGVRLALLDRDAAGLEKTKAMLSSASETYTLDITKEADVSSVIEKVGSAFGQIHILVNCAGITGKTNIQSHDRLYLWQGRERRNAGLLFLKSRGDRDDQSAGQRIC